MSHAPFRHAKELEVITKDQVLIDYDENEQQYVVFFTDKMVCHVNKCATFKSKDDVDAYLQAFCNQKHVQYGRIRFAMRVGRRIVFTKDYSLSAWNPTTANLDFVNLCMQKHKKAFDHEYRDISSEYTM